MELLYRVVCEFPKIFTSWNVWNHLWIKLLVRLCINLRIVEKRSPSFGVSFFGAHLYISVCFGKYVDISSSRAIC